MVIYGLLCATYVPQDILVEVTRECFSVVSKTSKVWDGSRAMGAQTSKDHKLSASNVDYYTSANRSMRLGSFKKGKPDSTKQ